MPLQIIKWVEPPQVNKDPWPILASRIVFGFFPTGSIIRRRFHRSQTQRKPEDYRWIAKTESSNLTRRLLTIVVLLGLLTTAGCQGGWGGLSQRWQAPGPTRNQQLHASVRDPYPSRDEGPELTRGASAVLHPPLR